MDIGTLMSQSCRHLSKAGIEAYNAPYPNKDYKDGVRRLPNLVMIPEDMEGVNISKSMDMYCTSDQFQAEKVFVAVEMKDPVLGPPVMRKLATMWKNGCYYLCGGRRGGAFCTGMGRGGRTLGD